MLVCVLTEEVWFGNDLDIWLFGALGCLSLLVVIHSISLTRCAPGAKNWALDPLQGMLLLLGFGMVEVVVSPTVSILMSALLNHSLMELDDAVCSRDLGHLRHVK